MHERMTMPAKASPSPKKGERRRKRRTRRNRRIAAAVVIAVLVFALLGMGLWLLFLQRPETTVQVYPMAYETEIRSNAAENGLDPALPAAVILAESSYLPDAVSEANAQGLMQLLPSTAQWVAGKCDEVYQEGSLFEPNTNIQYGCWYLGYLIRRFRGNLTCAIAAYHAGQGTVDGWLANPEYTADGETLQTIPSDATDTYVKRVLKYYEKYKELYAPAAR
jgi:soluble lytic murein transglycosylase